MAEKGDFSVGKRGPLKQFRMPDPSYYHPDMWSPNSKYTPHDKLQAVAAYVITGDLDRAEQHSGVPRGTIAGWKRNTEWFPAMMAQVREQQGELLDAEITSTIHDIVGEIKDRVENGDEVLHTKTGEMLRKKIPAKDLAITMAVLYDKRALARGDATTRTETVSTENKMDFLREEFRKFASAKQIDAEVETTQEGSNAEARQENAVRDEEGVQLSEE